MNLLSRRTLDALIFFFFLLHGNVGNSGRILKNRTDLRAAGNVAGGANSDCETRHSICCGRQRFDFHQRWWIESCCETGNAGVTFFNWFDEPMMVSLLLFQRYHYQRSNSALNKADKVINSFIDGLSRIKTFPTWTRQFIGLLRDGPVSVKIWQRCAVPHLRSVQQPANPTLYQKAHRKISQESTHTILTILTRRNVNSSAMNRVKGGPSGKQ